MDFADVLEDKRPGFEIFRCEESCLAVCGVGGCCDGSDFDELAGSFGCVCRNVLSVLWSGAKCGDVC